MRLAKQRCRTERLGHFGDEDSADQRQSDLLVADERQPDRNRLRDAVEDDPKGDRRGFGVILASARVLAVFPAASIEQAIYSLVPRRADEESRADRARPAYVIAVECEFEAHRTDERAGAEAHDESDGARFGESWPCEDRARSEKERGSRS